MMKREAQKKYIKKKTKKKKHELVRSVKIYGNFIIKGGKRS